MKCNEVYHGFRLTAIRPVEELNLTAYRFIHEKSGADLLWLANEDENRAFSIAFKTLPENSTGVFHILEHSTLCGSEKYPLREPFVDLLKGSLQTFLNAMTYPDKTMYPVASTNEKDFVNLMSVYLDAVFHPRIYSCEEIFMQEGWHYTPASDGEEGGFSGVVYNEMKGSYSSPDSQMYQALQEQMFPDNCYRFSAGGDPVEIPRLTYRDFLETHSRYYHPDNSYIYLYGKMDIDEKLEYLDREYLNRYTARGVRFDIPYQKPLGDKTVRTTYEISENEEETRNTLVARATLLCDYSDLKTQMGMDMLLEALTASNEAPLKAAVLKAGLGDEFSAWVDRGIQQASVAFYLKKADAGRVDEFLSVINDTLKELAEKGIDKNLLEAQINRNEFRLRELDFGNSPGVVLATAVMNTWLYGGDPVDAILNTNILSEIRAEMQDGYFENLIRTHLLSPNHAVTLIMEPSKAKAKERIKSEKERQKAYETSLSAAELEENAAKLERLKAYQNTEDSPQARAMLPHLELSDLKREIHVTPVTVSTCRGVATRLYQMPTNGISYLNLYYNADSVSEEELPYLSLLSSVLFHLGTSERSALDFENQVMLKTGDLFASASGYSPIANPDEYHQLFRVGCKYLDKGYRDAVALMEEGLLKTVFDSEELKKHIRRQCSECESNIVWSGNLYALLRCGSSVKREFRFKDMTRGCGYLDFLKKLCKNLDEQIDTVTDKLAELLKRIVGSAPVTVSLTAEEKTIASYEKEPLSFPAQPAATGKPDAFEARRSATGITIPASVVFDSMVGDYRRAGLTYSGQMLVLGRILTLDYLWNRVRMRGGAYGVSAKFDELGNILFSSYRDPHVARTYDAFRGSVDYLRTFEADPSEMTKYVIGVFSTLDTPLRPNQEAFMCDMQAFDGSDNPAYRQSIRDGVLATTAADICAFAEPLEVALKDASLCTVGAADKLQSDKALFDSIE